MQVNNIKTEQDYDKALNRADELFMSEPNTPQGNELALLLLAIKDYEDKNHVVQPAPQ
jgi:HTH-type transcriptional regulator/antitoxin HigA